MKDQLTKQELATYLPWGLEAKLSKIGIFNLDSEYPNEHQNKVCTITNYGFMNGDFYGQMKVNDSNYSFDFDTIDEIDLLLLPLSSLTQEIEHKGEKFVPIERLFDINLGTEWSKTKFIENGYTDTEWWVCLKEKPSWYFGYNIENGFYHIDINGFHKYLKKTNILYQKLAEWHIDFQNLIPQGKAIDKTTIQ